MTLAALITFLGQDDPESSGGLLRWLLGLEKVDPTAPDVVLGWEYPVPIWGWAMIVIAVGWVAWMSYRSLLGRKPGRITLGVTRGLILFVLALLLAGPVMILPRENREHDHVLMLVDRSTSLSVGDITVGNTRFTRDDQLKKILTDNAELWAALGREHHVDWMGFSDRPLPMADEKDLKPLGGNATAIRSAIEESLRRTAGKPVSAVVLLTDGRSSEPVTAATLRALERLDVPVFAVPLGAARAMLDLTVERVDAPDRAFVKDAVPVAVTVSRSAETGSPAEPAPPGTTVKLVDTTTGETLDEKPVGKLGEPVRLLHTPKAAGKATWRVVVSSPDAELSLANNEQTMDLTLEDRPVRVLYVEGYPRWEYRYLKTLLNREDSLESSIMLISADRSFAQEGDVPLRRLPQTEEEMRPYDVIAIGDVPPGYFSAEQMRLIYEQVSVGGAGLMFIGGSHDMPVSYAASPLSALLPVSGSQAAALLPTPIVMKPTSQARSLGVLNLISPGEKENSEGWPADLQPLLWAQSVDSLKPATEVLAIDEASNKPLIVRMRFGAGQSLYLATDEIWRWRKPWGDLYMDQFWTQLFRLLARGRLESGAAANDRAMFTVSRRRAATGDTLTVELTIRDQTLLDRSVAGVDVVVTSAVEDSRRGAERSEQITLTAADTPGVYRATWSPRIAGRSALRVTSPSLAELNLERIVEVADADAEMRYPITDHESLKQLAEKTKGAVIAPDQVAQLAQKIKNRARITTADISEPLTRSPLAFGLLLILLTGEWVGRKLLGLA